MAERRTSIDLIDNLRIFLQNEADSEVAREGSERCDALVEAITDDIGHVRAPVRHDRDRFEKALEEIRDQHWVENVLDPQWSARIAKEVLDG